VSPDYAALDPGYTPPPAGAADAIGLSRRHLYILSRTAVITGDFDMLARDEDILKAAEDWRREGRGVALATVMETWGSAPRPVGSNLVIDKDGNFLGSVSGGCVEGAVVTEAIDVIESGKPRMLEFGVADDAAWKVGLSCGGTIRVYVEKVE
jgi:hydroxyethylthiazole kinase-like sugar kinase family protein